MNTCNYKWTICLNKSDDLESYCEFNATSVCLLQPQMFLTCLFKPGKQTLLPPQPNRPAPWNLMTPLSSIAPRKSSLLICTLWPPRLPGTRSMHIFFLYKKFVCQYILLHHANHTVFYWMCVDWMYLLCHLIIFAACLRCKKSWTRLVSNWGRCRHKWSRSENTRMAWRGSWAAWWPRWHRKV